MQLPCSNVACEPHTWWSGWNECDYKERMHISEQSGKAVASSWDLHLLLRYMQRDSRIYTEAIGSVWTCSNIEAVCRRLVLIAMPHKYMESLQLLHNAAGKKCKAVLQSADNNQHYCCWYMLVLIREDEISSGNNCPQHYCWKWVVTTSIHCVFDTDVQNKMLPSPRILTNVSLANRFSFTNFY